MGEYEFYGTQGQIGASVQDRRNAFFGGGADKRREWYLTALGIPDGNYSVSDLEVMYYRSLGGSGSINDLRSQYWNGNIAPVEGDQMVARFSFNDPGNIETFDTVAGRRMALTSFEKVAGYDGQAISSVTSSAIGEVSSSLLTRDKFTIAARQYIATITATGPGGGVRYYAPDGTTAVASLLVRPSNIAGSQYLNVVASVRQGGVIKSVGGNKPIELFGLTADSYYWSFLSYDGETLRLHINNTQAPPTMAVAGLVDEAASSQVYATSTASRIDDVRIFNYAIAEAERLAIIGE